MKMNKVYYETNSMIGLHYIVNPPLYSYSK